MMTVEREFLGSCLHVGLRKACDSHATSLMWNIVPMAKVGWQEYLDAAWTGLHAVAPSTQEEAGRVLKDAALSLELGHCERNAIRLTFELFEDDEFAAMAAYCFD